MNPDFEDVHTRHLRVYGCDEWDNPVFNPLKTIQEEEDYFTEFGFDVEEGISECKKCGSKKVHSWTAQVRSSDEGYTSFFVCANPKCKSKWSNN